MKKNILVFPCGSEIALEVYRSVRDSSHFNLIGASSVDDHGKFVFDNYIGGVPFISDSHFCDAIRKIVKDYSIDAIYPAMDAVIEVLKANELFLGCKIISSCLDTTKMCLSKSLTYKHMKNVVKTPRIYDACEVMNYPVFVKPDVGYGSRGVRKVNNDEELKVHLLNSPASIICEYLPGKEYTVDCFTDKNGTMLVAKPRERCRVMNGISVNTKPMLDNEGEFYEFAVKINTSVRFRGAWFFQVKRDSNGQLVLLEMASRFGGSSSLFRAKGINFAAMSLYDAFDLPVSVLENDYDVELDRALDNKYRIDVAYNEVFVDFDDCIVLENKKVNVRLVSYLYECVNRNVRITLLTKHDNEKLGELDVALENLRIRPLFDRIIHIGVEDEKYLYIDNRNSVFIDDSFAERKKVSDNCKIPVFSLDMVEVL